MRIVAIVVALVLGTGGITSGAEATFKKSKMNVLVGKKQKLVNVSFRVAADSLVVVDKKTSETRAEIPYSRITSMSYEMAKRHRIEEGATLMLASLGAGAVLMATKTKSHWLAVEYTDAANSKQQIILQLHKDEYGPAIAALEENSGRKVEILTGKESKANPTAGSVNVDEVVAFPTDRVRAALKLAMERHGCRVTEEKAGQIECKRARGSNELTGVGGEKITATLASEGSSTRVKIETGKGFAGRMRKKNWSTPVFRDMLANLESGAAKS